MPGRLVLLSPHAFGVLYQGGRVLLANLNHEMLTEQYGVRSVPTLLLFNQGGVQDQIVGRTTEQTVRDRLERLT